MAKEGPSRRWHSISEYEAMRALMQAGTTTAASAQLGLSQSAVSRSISALEARMGCTLFEREAGRLRPTREAVQLNRRLDPLFDALNRIEGPAEPVQEALRLIAPPSYAQRYLVTQIGGFLKANPNIHLSFEVRTSEEVVRGILDDGFDLGIYGVDTTRAGIKTVPFRVAPAVCAMHRDHPLAKRQEIRPSDLDGQPLIHLSKRHARRNQLNRLLVQARAHPHVVAEVSTSSAAADLAGEGLGLSVINPFPVWHYRPEALVLVPFASPISYRMYFAVSDNNPVPRSARSFMRHLRLNTPPDPFSQKV